MHTEIHADFSSEEASLQVIMQKVGLSVRQRRPGMHRSFHFDLILDIPAGTECVR